MISRICDLSSFDSGLKTSLGSFFEIRESEAESSTDALPIRVLVSEPDAVSRRLICSLLECESGLTATCVDDSRLVSSIQESAPDLVILDCVLQRSDELRAGKR